MKKLLLIIPLVFLLCFTFSCQKDEEVAEEPVVDVEAEIEAVKKADGDWLRSVQDKDIDKVLSFYWDDAMWPFRDAPTIKGKEKIKEVWLMVFNIPGFWIKWEPMKVEVSNSADLAYSAGTYELRQTDEEGKIVTEKGEYVVVWKKAPDGNWKLVIDMSN
jgi:ketosteroid isomerase-like protein